jgi:PAS domain S-box/diguanylate cyclase (GGDEF) domain
MTTSFQKYDSKDKFDFSNLKKETGFIIDSNGSILFVEKKISDIIGYSDEELINTSYTDYIYDKESINELSFIPHYSKNFDLSLRHKNGHPVYVQVTLEYQFSMSTEVFQFYGIMSKIIKPQIISDLDIISKVIDNSRDVLYRYSVVGKKLLYLSKSAFQLFGYMPEEIISDFRIFLKSIHPEDAKKLHARTVKSFDFSKPVVTRLRHRDGYYVCIEDCMTPYYDENGTLLYIDGACRDITKKVEFEKRLHYLTFHDALTGLYNRNYFEEEFNRLNSEVDIPIALILCDLDNLKIVNDSLGHDNGDQMIIHVGKLLASLVDCDGFAARIGGDEFVIILKNMTFFDLKQLIVMLTNEISEYNKCLVDYSINMSIGSAYNEHSLNNMKRLFKMADTQMYLNKSARKAL